MRSEDRADRITAPPSGTYLAVLRAVEPALHDLFGAGLRFVFRVEDGPWAGAVVEQTTGRRPTARNACGLLLAGLLGRPLEPGEVVELEALIGHRFEVDIERRAGPWGGPSRAAVRSGRWPTARTAACS